MKTKRCKIKVLGLIFVQLLSSLLSPAGLLPRLHTRKRTDNECDASLMMGIPCHMCH